MTSSNICLLIGIRFVGRLRQVVWRSGGTGCLTKLCLESGYGILGTKPPIYDVGLQLPNMERLEGVGAVELLEGRAKSFFGHVVHAVGEGFHIRFQYDPWSNLDPSKDFYPDLSINTISKEAWIADLVFNAPEGGGRC